MRMYADDCVTYNPATGLPNCHNCFSRLPKREVRHRVNIEAFLDNQELTDFEFVVKYEEGPDVMERRFRVHKTFVAMRSEMFRAMFFRICPLTDQMIITDVHPDGFETLLRFLYSARVKAKCFEDALRARVAAKKYCVQQLDEACSALIRMNLKAVRLCSFIDLCMRIHYPYLDEAAETLLKSSNAPAVLVSKGFNTALEETVRYIVEEIREVHEEEVAHAVFGWAQEQCERSAQTDRPLELNTLMRSFFPKLRFLTMTAQAFLKGPGSWDLLDDAEVIAVLRNIVRCGWCPLPAGFCDVTHNRFTL
ncbi:BTB/POZ domain-containing protein 6-like [Dermacentor silvarum]|uniref:BTB/POZ domain-containing protein 6-like n=1 Tax=Dermacentor silvarum TaxID=543639 RepID=UPI0018982B0E|nr:BTB/POZ domain-containing protein 6-like [Dermacentor silvarum]